MNTPVNFEVAKLLKEKGFDEKCRFVYNNWNNIFDWVDLGEGERRNSDTSRLFGHGSIYYSAPTIAEVVMWLYEKHEYWIAVDVMDNGKWFFTVVDVPYSKVLNDNDPSLEEFNSPTEAYEAAITYTLNNLIMFGLFKTKEKKQQESLEKELQEFTDKYKEYFNCYAFTGEDIVIYTEPKIVDNELVISLIRFDTPKGYANRASVWFFNQKYGRDFLKKHRNNYVKLKNQMERLGLSVTKIEKI